MLKNIYDALINKAKFIFNTVKNSKVLQIYIWSYSIILLLPLLSYIALIEFSILPSYKNEIYLANNEQIKQSAEKIENVFVGLKAISEFANENINFSTYSISNNDYGKIQIVNELKKIRLSNPYISDVLYFIKNGDMIYGSKGGTNISNFSKGLYKYNEISFEEYYKILNNSTVFTILKTQNVNNKDILTCIAPVKNYATMVFMLDAKVIKSELQYASYNSRYSSAILDSNNKIILLNDGINAENTKLALQEYGKKDKPYFKNLMISEYKSSGNLTYLYAIDTDILLGKIISMHIVYTFLTILLFLIGFIVVVFLALKMYSPVKNILNKLKQDEVSLGTYDEFKTIDFAVDELKTNNDNLKNKLSEYRPIIKKYILAQLLNNENKLVDVDFNYDDEFNLGLPTKPYYSVIIISYRNFDDKINVTKRLVNVFNNEDVNLVHTGHNANGDMIFLIAIKNINGYKSIIVQIKSTIDLFFNLTSSISAGGICENLSEVCIAYAQATKAYTYSQKCNLDIVMHDDVHEIVELDENDLRVFWKEIEALKSKLTSNEFSEFKNIFKSICHKIEHDDMPMFYVRMFILDVFNMVIKKADEIELKDIGDIRKHMTIFEFSPTQISREYIIRASEVINQIFDLIELDSVKTTYLKNRLTTYISQNYLSCDFSLTLMAEQFGMSTSHLSNLFKTITGNNINDYVTELRFNDAKRLLKNTNLTLAEISVKVGYFNTASFIRRFKAVVGCTPGEFRK